MVNQPAPRGIESVTRELDHRWSDGVSVTLLWNTQTNRVSVAVMDEQRGVAFEFPVQADDALDAFHHPYAYAADPDDDAAFAA
jgi:hypothetical protein